MARCFQLSTVSRCFVGMSVHRVELTIDDLAVQYASRKKVPRKENICTLNEPKKIQNCLFLLFRTFSVPDTLEFLHFFVANLFESSY